VTLPGDCAMALPVRTFEMDPGVTIGLIPVEEARSGFTGMSTWRSVDFTGASAVEVAAGHGGAGGWIGGCEASGDWSGAGASGISSSFGSVAFGVVISASSILITIVGDSVRSLAGVGSRGLTSAASPVDKSIAEGSSSGGEGGSGDGLLEDTSLRVGDLASIFTDVDRRRSRCNLSSWACWSSLRLNDNGGFICRDLAQA
jgi:hypothetical protein